MSDIPGDISSTVTFEDAGGAASISSTFETFGDVDFIRLELTEATVVEFFFSHTATTGLQYSLLDATGEPIVGGSSALPGYFLGGAGDLDPGVYFISVSTYDGRPANYSLSLSTSHFENLYPGTDGTFGTAGERVIGGAGADNLLLASGVIELLGAHGNDELTGNADGNAIWGGTGDDRLWGEGGDDRLFGESGDDQLFGYDGTDRLYGGSGFDNLYGENGHDFLFGGDGADTLIGGAGNDTIDGGLGDDTYYIDLSDTITDAGGTDTILVGGSFSLAATPDIENLVVTGRSNAVTLTGNAANNVISDDTVVYNDTLSGGTGGNDTLISRAGSDTLLAWSGHDIFRGNGTTTISFAGWVSGVTIDLGVATAQAVAGGSLTLSGITRATGGNGDDVITGSSGIDTLAGGAGGDDVLTGGGGGDTFLAWSGDDVFAGGTGAQTDLLSFETWNAGVTLDLGKTTAQAVAGGSVTVSGIEDVSGGKGNDTFRGSNAADTFYGNGGDDTFHAWNGADHFDGGTHELTGDTLSFTGWSSSVVLDLGLTTAQTIIGLTVVGVENATGGNGNDTLTGSEESNVLAGGLGGNDTLSGDSGNDVFLAWSGNDTFNGDGDGELGDTVSFAGWNSSVTIDLNETGAQTVSGGSVTLSGIENVIGGNGNDTLTASSDSNTLTGGAGDDTFRFVAPSGEASRDYITDFSAGDIIDVSGIDTGIAAGDQSYEFIGKLTFAPGSAELGWTQLEGNTIVLGRSENGDIHIIELSGLHNLTAADFIL